MRYVTLVLIGLCSCRMVLATDGASGRKHSTDGQSGVGHLRPLGNQNIVIKGEIDEFFSSIPGRAFCHEFWIPGKPVVFRGVIKHSAALRNWIRKTYMTINYGSVKGIVDRRTTWKKGGIESPPRSVMNYSDFLRRLPREELYWDDKIPRGHRILKDIPLPLFFNCKELLKSVAYVNMMANSGNASYVLHSDPMDNLFHFIAGRKTWLIANSLFSDSLYIGNGSENIQMSPVVPDSVNLLLYPRVAEVIFHEITLWPGDILYIPRDWPHYVRSSGFPNIGLNIWFGSKDTPAASTTLSACRRQHVSAYEILRRRMNSEDNGGEATF